MVWVLTAILCVVLIEIAVRLPLPDVLSEIVSVGRKSCHLLTTGAVSDHWKEKAMLAYAAALFKATAKLAAILATVGVAAVLMLWMFGYLDSAIMDFVTSWSGILYSVVVATLCFKARKFFVGRRIQPA